MNKSCFVIYSTEEDAFFTRISGPFEWKKNLLPSEYTVIDTSSVSGISLLKSVHIHLNSLSFDPDSLWAIPFSDGSPQFSDMMVMELAGLSSFILDQGDNCYTNFVWYDTIQNKMYKWDGEKWITPLDDI